MPALPRKLWLLVCAVGVALAVVFAILPVGVDFTGDPLLRLRQLDPQLSPPPTTAVCGSPVSHLTVNAKGTSLYEVARADACEDAARRRFLIALALGAAIVTWGLVGLASPGRWERREVVRPDGKGGGPPSPPPTGMPETAAASAG